MLNLTDAKQNRVLETALILVTVGLTALLMNVVGYKMVVLHLYYLPVVLAAFFLGRYYAGVLALLSVVLASGVIAFQVDQLTIDSSPLAVALSVTIWAGTLGLTTILVGTLSDERRDKLVELNEAYVGVVEVMAQYLQNGNPALQDRSRRIADLSQQVATSMKLSGQEIDQIRVAAMLQGMKNLEITARVIRRAVGDLGASPADAAEHTFQGTDLAHSLGSKLSGALPMLLGPETSFDDLEFENHERLKEAVPFGSQIIQAASEYDDIVNGIYDKPVANPSQALLRLQNSLQSEIHPAVLHALEQVVEIAPPVDSAEEELAVAGV
jgi:hypothetical protein